jgi:sensor histidine kinase YesM
MKINFYAFLQFGLLTTAGILLCNNIRSQTSDTTRTINFPLPYEHFSLYDFAEVRFETDKTERPPADIIKRNFQPIKKIFQKDSLYFDDSVHTVWFKFSMHNNYASDTSVSLTFHPIGVNKAVLYKKQGEKIIFVGKTGWAIAVIARTISYEDNRIDLLLKAQSQTDYFIQIPRLGFNFMLLNTPALESILYAEKKAFNREIVVNRPNFLWNHFFIGIFFMFFVFGFIKYLVLGRDRAYLYYALLGLSNAILTVAQAEYPPLELPWFENLRGIELFNLVNGVAILMQGLFILEILQLKIKYPRIALATKWFLFLQLLIAAIYTATWIAHIHKSNFFVVIYPYHQFLLLLVMLSWVLYLATIRKGFYRFIFLGAVTIFIAFTLYFLVQFFNLYYLLPAWVATDPRGSVNHFMQLALLIDMCFYFTGLAYRDRQVEKDKILLENDLKLQHLEGEKIKAEFEQQASQLEMQALRAQMNPHFIFNSLNSINRFILQNNKAQASEYLTKFSKLVRMILQNSQASLITLESELEALQLYLDLEALRFDQHFDYKITVPDDIDTDVLKVPPLIIQPYAENAIWHGLMHKEEKGHLNIEVSQNENHLLFKITDDGIGRRKAAVIASTKETKHKSMGLKITADRIAMLQRLNGNESPVTINDLVNADGSAAGTEVVIKMPVIYA